MQDFEILAPVKDEENFYQAINNGADAVYLGLKDFNARQKASNFDDKNLKKIVEYAHFFGVKVYVALNTIVVDGEVERLVELVKLATSCQVDAFIVQDLGVAKILKDCFKNIVLHGSTQLGVHNLYGAKMCEQMGLTRVVLSRETTLEDIKQIKQNTNLELEFFVQGALCVAFSGVCYLSSIKHDCSGNRGKCLQLCRLCYSAEDKNKKEKGYFLSPTDLCFIDKIKDLFDIGITSFKIEGRLRRPSYVALTSKYFSLAKKSILNNQPLNKEEYLKAIKKVFYRGEYNNGFYFEKQPQKNIINTSFQNHRGVLIGKVLSVKPFKDIYQISIKTPHKIIKNDGLKFVDKQGFELSMGVGSVSNVPSQRYVYDVYSKVKPKVDDDVYLTVDFEWEQNLLNNKQKKSFDAYFEAKQNTPAKLVITSGKLSVEAKSDFILPPAKKHGLTEEDIKQCLQKADDLPIKLNNFSCCLQNVFIPKSKLNELRRKAFENFYKAVIDDYIKTNMKVVCFKQEAFDALKIKARDAVYQNYNFVCVDEKIIKNDVEALKRYVQYKFVLSPVNFSIENIIQCFDKAKELGFKDFYLNLPKVARYKDFLKLNQIILSLPQQIGLIANNIYAINYINQKRNIVGGAYLNIANKFSAYALKQFGINSFIKSFESFAKDFDKGVSYQGKPALMTFCHCPYKTVHKNELCKDCKYTGFLTYKDDAENEYKIRRTKIEGCVFELISNHKLNLENGQLVYVDLR